MSSKPDYAEFNDSRLVAIYDTVNPIIEYQAFYVDLAAKLSAKKVLDIGCGTGLLTRELAQRGHTVIGIEPSRDMFEVAQRRLDGTDVALLEGDVLRLDHFDADLAIMTGHVAQFYLEDAAWQAALSNIHDALKPNGYLSFESRNPLTRPFASWPTEKTRRKLHDPKVGEVEWWSNILEAAGNKVRYEIHYYLHASNEKLVSVNELVFRTRADLERSLENAGFVVEKVLGDWDGSRASSHSPEMIFIAKRR